ncbi:MAG: hypothetical protein IPH45_14250 [Bacteroidales bacterium]|nr:hypothetical protein [Bacteroidales bacterium]
MKFSTLIPARLLLLIIILFPAVSMKAQTLWGVSTDSSGIVYKFDINKQEFKIVHYFTSGEKSSFTNNRKPASYSTERDFSFEEYQDTNINSGVFPQGVLVKGNDSFIYGITSSGGDHNSGVLFRIDTLNLAYEELYSFGMDRERKPNHHTCYVTANQANSPDSDKHPTFYPNS